MAEKSKEPRAPFALSKVAMTYADEDGSSGSGDDAIMLDGHKRHAGVPSSSGASRKRGRKAAGGAIVDAMLEIAAASKMRASAIMKSEDRFSVSKCIKLLDETQDAPISMEDIDLELDEMELVAAAAGYYYYSCLTKQPSRCLSPRRCEFVSEVLNGHDDYCREMLRMDKHFLSSMQEQFAYSLRDSIAAAMWDDFLNKWDEW
ncbi:hypothetical protein Ahy_A05g023793 isoform A [Arachis hypogaea]|uniref:Uncharacterized protein n=1 Tax=Arachis hypogaea TaxID=3818 RepID=A0A445D522_ARAHY|nr:hypothetical protein Ahy_A05g023793 isoform A [Arachis hypogaea]